MGEVPIDLCSTADSSVRAFSTRQQYNEYKNILRYLFLAKSTNSLKSAI